MWIYLFIKSQDKEDIRKKDILKELLLNQRDISVSVQVLNEVANVLMKKFGYSEQEVTGFLNQILFLSDLMDLSKGVSFSALQLKARYQLSWFDSLIVSAALETNSTHLYSEDMQHGLKIEDRLTIVNPFK